MSDSELGRAQDPADEETIAKAEEANRLAAEHGVADPGGLPGAVDAESEPPQGRPTAADAGTEGGSASDDRADDVIEELGPAE
jgi:hypothetical protein